MPDCRPVKIQIGDAFNGMAQILTGDTDFPDRSDYFQGGCADALPPKLSPHTITSPDERFKAGARQFPILVPIAPNDPAVPANPTRLRKFFTGGRKPFLTAVTDGDPVTKGTNNIFTRRFRELAMRHIDNNRERVISCRRTRVRGWRER